MLCHPLYMFDPRYAWPRLVPPSDHTGGTTGPARAARETQGQTSIAGGDGSIYRGLTTTCSSDYLRARTPATAPGPTALPRRTDLTGTLLASFFTCNIYMDVCSCLFLLHLKQEQTSIYIVLMWRCKHWMVVYLARTLWLYTHQISSSNMTLVSNDPSWWPLIDSTRFFSYFAVASLAAVIYDWVLTLGQEIELIWRQRWSLMTILYLVTRYVGTPYSVIYMLQNIPSVSVTDAGCSIMYYTISWTNVVVTAMLGVIMIARLHAMYHGSRKMLIFLVVTFLAVNIGCGIITAIGLKHIVGEELILSGTYACSLEYEIDILFLITMVYTLNTIWEVLALFLAVWIAVKHFRDLRRFGLSTGSTVGDCFTVLMKSHVLYFASFAAVDCLNLVDVFTTSSSVGAQIYFGVLQIFVVVQMFVLGPRLILSVREYHAKLVADSDAAIGMISIVFHERVHVSTSGTV